MGGEQLDMNGVSVDAVIWGAWTWGRTLTYGMAAVLFTIAAAAYPAWRVTRLSPVAAMRHH